MQDGEAIEAYVEALRAHGPIPSQEFEDIIFLVNIVHDNLPLCLNSLKVIGLPISAVRDLITRIAV